MREVWKDITGYEGEYRISNYGRVMSLIGKHPRMLKLRYNKNGYAKVSLHAKNDIGVHRLVAMMFLDNPDNLPEVNHKDENPSNNCVNNLEWCTHRYNITYGTCQARARATQSITYPQQNRGDCSKQVLCIDTGVIYPSVGEASRQLNIHRTAIGMVCRGVRKKAGELHFKYLETH